ncbi:MAG TPA: Uma2 family endonuclease [Solirubrobacteraceae bacterium]|jgi:hypothetical protein
MAFAVGDRAVRPLTADEVMAMAAAGIIGDEERVELLHGVLTKMSANHPPHAGITLRLGRWLAPLSADARYDVRVQLPLVVPDPTSLPEPDLAVVERGGEVERHPATALLVIEVAQTSLKVDTTIKPPLFAAAGVSEMWVVDVEHKRLEVCTEPGPEGYARQATLEPPGRVHPEGVAIEPLDLAGLFAGLEGTAARL